MHEARNAVDRETVEWELISRAVESIDRNEVSEDARYASLTGCFFGVATLETRWRREAEAKLAQVEAAHMERLMEAARLQAIINLVRLGHSLEEAEAVMVPKAVRP